MERKCEESVEVCGISFPKDMNIIVPVHSLHRMTAIWGDPDVFRPERLVTIRSGSFPYYNNTYSTCHGKVSVPFWYHIVILSPFIPAWLPLALCYVFPVSSHLAANNARTVAIRPSEGPA